MVILPSYFQGFYYNQNPLVVIDEILTTHVVHFFFLIEHSATLEMHLFFFFPINITFKNAYNNFKEI